MTSDYRSPHTNNTPTELNNLADTNNTNSTYSRMVQSIKFPDKEQAIVLNTANTIQLQEYIKAIGSLVHPKSILFASRISNNRICIYLSSKDLVNSFLKKHQEIKIGDERIHIRRLVTPAQRLVLSNVCPTIPHNLLENHLKEIGLKLISPLSFLRINTNDTAYSHIYSFRRQIYISPNDDVIIPESFLVNFENTSYRIFLSSEGLACFKCKQSGHIATQCPTQSANSAEIINAEIQNPNTQHENARMEIIESQSHKRPASQENLNIEDPDQVKQSTSTEVFAAPSSDPKHQSQTRKKIKKDNPQENVIKIQETMEAARSVIEKEFKTLNLNFDQIVDFFDKVHGSPDPLSIVKEYTTNVMSFLETLSKIYPSLEHRALKARCTRIRRKILKQINQELESGINTSVSDEDTDRSSQHSTY